MAALRLLALPLLIPALVGCDDIKELLDTGGDTGSDTGASAGFVVDAAGGTFDLGDGARMTVPAGALDRETTITVELLPPPVWAPDAVTDFVGINPEPKIHFLGAPVTLELPVSASPEAGTRVAVTFIEPADAAEGYEREEAWMATEPIDGATWNDNPEAVPEVAASIQGYDPAAGWSGETERLQIGINQLCYIGIVPVGE